MDLLDKLFSYEYFETILFIVIGVLLFLFIIVYFLGKRDEKKRRKIQEAEESASASAAFDTDITKANELVNSDLEEPIKTDDRFKGFDDININSLTQVSDNTGVFDPIITDKYNNYELPTDDIKMNNNESIPTEEQPILSETHDFDLSSLEATLDSINKENAVKEPVEVPTEPEVMPKEEVNEPVLPPKQPEVFSSVFVNKAPEIKKVVDESPLELPKKAEMPILKEETTSNSFPNFEEETYKLK